MDSRKGHSPPRRLSWDASLRPERKRRRFRTARPVVLLSGAFTVLWVMLRPIQQRSLLPDTTPDVSSFLSPSHPQPSEDSVCTCVDCQQDPFCGGLWKGDAVGGDPYSFSRVTIVVSHCLHSLDWLSKFTEGMPVHNITVISKCNSPVEGIPEDKFALLRLPNVGRCDHSYAYWMNDYVTHGTATTDEENGVVVFLKDDRSDASIHQPGSWRSLHDMLRIASVTGFACGMKPTRYGKSSVSSYHEVSSLMMFRLKNYASAAGRYDRLSNLTQREAPFASQYHNMGAWASRIGVTFPKDLVQVCYAGTFAASTRRIRARGSTLWSALEKSLARSNNIEEGHFAERSWGGLLSNPLTDTQVVSMRNYSRNVLHRRGSVWGALRRQN